MDTLHSAAHLQREIGDELFAALINSDNTAAVREFAATLIKSILPTTMTLGGVTYDILSFLRGDEKSVVGQNMVERAKEMQAHLGKEDREHVLAHQDEIPIALRGKVVFVFTDDRHPAYPERVYYVYWDGGRWVEDWSWLGREWIDVHRVLRRKSAR